MIERYDCSSDTGGECIMEEHINGEFVRFEDVKELIMKSKMDKFLLKYPANSPYSREKAKAYDRQRIRKLRKDFGMPESGINTEVDLERLDVDKKTMGYAADRFGFALAKLSDAVKEDTEKFVLLLADGLKKTADKKMAPLNIKPKA